MMSYFFFFFATIVAGTINALAGMAETWER